MSGELSCTYGLFISSYFNGYFIASQSIVLIPKMKDKSLQKFLQCLNQLPSRPNKVLLLRSSSHFPDMPVPLKKCICFVSSFLYDSRSATFSSGITASNLRFPTYPQGPPPGRCTLRLLATHRFQSLPVPILKGLFLHT